LQPGVPAFTVPQPENAMAVVADRAREIKVFILNTTCKYWLCSGNKIVAKELISLRLYPKAPLHVVPSLEHYPGKLPGIMKT